MSAHPFDVFIIRSQRFGYREYEGGKGAKFGGGGGQPFLHKNGPPRSDWFTECLTALARPTVAMICRNSVLRSVCRC